MNRYDEDHLNVDTEAELATGPATATVLGSIAEALSGAPEDRRYNFELAVREVRDD